MTRTRCIHCRAEIETAFGCEPPGAHDGAEGTFDDPRAPGDYDNVCDVCNYGEGLRGGPDAEPREEVAAQP